MGGSVPGLRLAAFGMCLLVSTGAAAQETYSFDVSAFEKKPVELSGYAELRGESFQLDQDAALYQLGFFDREPRADFQRGTGTVELRGLYRHGDTTAQFVGHSTYQDDFTGTAQDSRLYEAYASHQTDTRTRYDLGKKTLSWGKGYAWNPVGFIQRPKDPNDPDLARQGFVIAGADFVRSFSGDLKTVAFTPLVVPTYGDANADFGGPLDTGDHANPAAKLYMLYRDTDIDLMALGQGSRSARYGVDFSRNISSNFEIHGEWAHIGHTSRPVIGPGGSIAPTESSATSYLLGLRYLTENELTSIVEYDHDGTGYSEDELSSIYSAVHDAYAQYQLSADPTALSRLRTAFQPVLMQPNPGRNYLYLRMSQNQPFDILYFTPALTVIANLDDHSYSVAPEVTYTGVSNLELRLRVFWLNGGRLTDFGEKQNDRRIELRVRYYF